MQKLEREHVARRILPFSGLVEWLAREFNFDDAAEVIVPTTGKWAAGQKWADMEDDFLWVPAGRKQQGGKSRRRAGARSAIRSGCG